VTRLEAAVTGTVRSATRVLQTLALPLLLMIPALAPAQESEVTEEQTELFKSLPPEQQQAILEEFLRSRAAGEPTREESRQGDARRRQALDGAADKRRLSPERQPQPEEERREPKLERGSSVIVDLDLKGRPESPVLAELRSRILQRNPYRLDALGRLQLPGFEPLSMLGLSETLAAKRLATDPALSEFRIKVTVLPLEPIGDEALEPFGYDLFTDAPSTFAPDTEIPVPSDYLVGPGDELRVQLFGNTNRSLTLHVSRDGQVSFPQIGPIAVSGMSFSEVKDEIESRVAEQMIGVRANVAMGETRSIRIFLLGEVPEPGSYTVSGLSTVTNALFVGGGINRIGSLRNVQLKRGGRLVKTLDLYDLLLSGDTRNDAQLLPGDVVFIPPIGPSVAASGEVLRPALYEIRPGSTLADLVQLAGGLAPRADAREARLERINERGERVVVNVALGSPEARALKLRNGDRLRVNPIRDTLEGAVLVDGHVLRPGAHEHRPGLRISDVLSFADLRPKADTHYVLIRRELPPDRRLIALSADLAAALANRGSENDVELEPRDQLTVFDLQSGRDRAVSAIVRELRSQATHDAPLQVVSIAGRVRAPGQYPLEPGMRVSDLLRAGGSLEDAAYGGSAELTRQQVLDGEFRKAELVKIDLAAVIRGDDSADSELAPYDTLTIQELPEWREDESVTLVGEVRFPGDYPLRRGETLHSVLQRAGGLTELAFPEGAIFMREDLREREQQQLDVLAQRLRRDLAMLALQGGAQTPPAISVAESLLAQLESTAAVGRLVIDVEAIAGGSPGGPSDIVLRPGDRLLVPKQSQEVTVIGEVQNATSHRWSEHYSRNDYVDLSGGFSTKADKKRVYVVRADGSVASRKGGAWFDLVSHQIRPGDSVVVPLNAERLRPFTLWTAATQILYNLAIAAAAVNSF